MKTTPIIRLAALALLIVAGLTASQARTLVAYYSFTGNTRTIVGELQQQIDADIVEVLPAEEGLDYAANNYAIGSSLIAAIRSNPDQASSYPAIKPMRIDVAAYDNIIIASPLWWSQMAAPMQTFLFEYGPAMAGKHIGLIVSSASSGISGVVADAKRLVPDGNFEEENLWIRSSQTSNAATLVRDWLTGIDWNDSDNDTAPQISVSDGTHTVTFALNNTSAAQSLLGMLPFTVDVSNYSNNEKIFYPPTAIAFGDDCIEGDCPAGTLALFSPWGNVVMYYGPASRYSGLYILGQAVEGADQIKDLSGTITVKRVGTEAPRGDVNGDSVVDIDDVNSLINIILHRD